ncbi:MAG: hypothetical protein JO309_12945 [Pseudonocardiales bacterium]|nr:hypothetical protein [Pseudonocardiales bacterium]MBV9730284.1 hypothetical protein [Pseudonocardiales bacterium]
MASAGATWPAFWLNLGWALAVVPALIVGTRLDGMRGTAIAHAGVAVLVAIPLAMWALHRSRVRLAPIGPALLRPLLAGGLAAATCLAVAGMAGTSPFVKLATAGLASLLVYAAVALPRAVLRQVGGRAGALIPARAR